MNRRLPRPHAGIAGRPTCPSTNAPATPTYTEETSLVTYDNLGARTRSTSILTNTGPNEPREVDAYDASNAAPGGGFPYSAGPLGDGNPDLQIRRTAL